MNDTTNNSANNSGEDYSLDRVPRAKRTAGWLSITNITFGIATAIFYIQMGSVMALNYGAINAIISAVYAIIVTDAILIKRILKIGPGYYEARQSYLHK